MTVAKRGYACKILLSKVGNSILYQLHTGSQWYQLPSGPEPNDPAQKEISEHAGYYHFRKWRRDGSLEKVWQGRKVTISADLNLSALNLDGSHVLAPPGGASVAYQGRKKAKTTKILPIAEGQGFIIASPGLIAGNHHDASHLKPHVQDAFKSIQRLGVDIRGALFNADRAFATPDARKTCCNQGVIPNSAEPKRNRKTTKRGPQRFFNQAIYKHRFISARSLAWIDKCRAW